ncbi:MAG: hypothetical protein A7315_08475 [Candidatus Altiarchaeales archaeon WOR_SM1_79]|nr:MAG: hypothetical protein A7315_08475 [Candidatus Altiarchaeales archaeon WOR_SM1_79]
MKEKNPKKKGDILRDEEDGAFIVNSRGTCFGLGRSVFWLWEACDGKTPVKQLAEDFGNKFKLSRTESREIVESILRNLEESGVLSRIR